LSEPNITVSIISLAKYFIFQLRASNHTKAMQTAAKYRLQHYFGIQRNVIINLVIV